MSAEMRPMSSPVRVLQIDGTKANRRNAIKSTSDSFGTAVQMAIAHTSFNSTAILTISDDVRAPSFVLRVAQSAATVL